MLAALSIIYELYNRDSSTMVANDEILVETAGSTASFVCDESVAAATSSGRIPGLEYIVFFEFDLSEVPGLVPLSFPSYLNASRNHCSFLAFS